MTLPILYKKSKTDAIVFCTIETHDEVILVVTGQVGTESPIKHTTTCAPKNVGRSNETTAAQQADLEAQSKWDKKIKGGYVTDESGESSVMLPQKVKVYQDQVKNVEFPCYDSPKLNGVNITVRRTGADLAFTSRGGDPRPPLKHLTGELCEAMVALDITEVNGEVYKHGEFLQDIQSATTKANDLTESLEFHIFDIPSLEGVPYSKRTKILSLLSKILQDIGAKSTFVIPVTEQVLSHEALADHHRQCVNSGYEGLVIYNAKGVYKHNQRSSDVFKLKVAQDAEFKVVGHNLDKHGHAVFHCITPEGLTFKVKTKGSDHQRLNLAAVAGDFHGKWLKVEFEEYSKDLKPLKPVGLAFRSCNEAGEPLE